MMPALINIRHLAVATLGFVLTSQQVVALYNTSTIDNTAIFSEATTLIAQDWKGFAWTAPSDMDVTSIRLQGTVEVGAGTATMMMLDGKAFSEWMMGTPAKNGPPRSITGIPVVASTPVTYDVQVTPRPTETLYYYFVYCPESLNPTGCSEAKNRGSIVWNGLPKKTQPAASDANATGDGSSGAGSIAAITIACILTVLFAVGGVMFYVRRNRFAVLVQRIPDDVEFDNLVNAAKTSGSVSAKDSGFMEIKGDESDP